jgi:hypothetical protein
VIFKVSNPTLCSALHGVFGFDQRTTRLPPLRESAIAALDRDPY